MDIFKASEMKDLFDDGSEVGNTVFIEHNVVYIEKDNGKVVAITDECICEYADYEAVEKGHLPKKMILLI